MRVIITEDIVKKALNESIDEFMLEEGAWDNLKNWYNNGNGKYIKNAVNGLKNAAAMYMDARTNGQWNRKYNIQAKGNGVVVGSYYLQKWFKQHYNRLYDIVWGDYYGNRQYFYLNFNGQNLQFQHDWKNNAYTLNYYGVYYTLELNYNNIPEKLKIKNSNGGEIENAGKPTYNRANNSYEFAMPKGSNVNNVIVYTGEDNSTPESYVANNCYPNNFMANTKNTLGDGNFKNAVRDYLEATVQKTNQENINKLKQNPEEQINYNYLLSLLTIQSFYKWYGENANNYKANQDVNNQPNQPKVQSNPKQAKAQQKGQEQRDAASNNVQGAQSHWANVTDNKKPRKAF